MRVKLKAKQTRRGKSGARDGLVNEWVELLGFITTALRVFAGALIAVADIGLFVRLRQHVDIRLPLILLFIGTILILSASTIAYVVFAVYGYGRRLVTWLLEDPGKRG